MSGVKLSESEVLDYLRENPESRPGSILQHFRTVTEDQNLKRKDVNRILYKLLREKKVTKEVNSEGNRPKWSFINKPDPGKE